MKPTRPTTAVIAALALTSFASPADAAIHLAFGVDTLESSTAFNRIRVRDLHGDHYHNFTQNNGNPGSSIPAPLVVIPGSGTATLNLAAMEISPFPQARYATGLTPAGDFHLELVGLTGIDATNLFVRFWHDGHTHTMSVGGNAEHLELNAINRIDFSLADGAPLGAYTAQFAIIDESGNYLDSPGFSIHVNAIPEPSSALLGASALVLGLTRRRRR